MIDRAYWLQLGLIALIAGLFNLPTAVEKLRKTCRELLFFEPLKSPGFWVWIIAQMLFPALVFLLWSTNFFATRPELTVMLVIQAIATGLGFVVFLNSRTETAFLTLDIKSIYDRVIVLGLRLIAAQETRRTAHFLRAFEAELKRPEVNLSEGLKDLRAYFSADISLTPAEEADYLSIIDQALNAKQRDEQIAIIQNLLPAVRPQDRLDTLRQFQCRETFLETYFPRLAPG